MLSAGSFCLLVLKSLTSSHTSPFPLLPSTPATERSWSPMPQTHFSTLTSTPQTSSTSSFIFLDISPSSNNSYHRSNPDNWSSTAQDGSLSPRAADHQPRSSRTSPSHGGSTWHKDSMSNTTFRASDIAGFGAQFSYGP
ncbi:hypothetical protein B0H66DRAFT_558506 [Apodospora peruviana]|uniref:Uncharacterized protein n=1 Tax=Apodospora peruviana TaxID=516989 RepID=A0AAE0I5G0_9PEZI|nr:hypothetical protein B0H66DRAFT_558506 [Apodospora peruviana]